MTDPLAHPVQFAATENAEEFLPPQPSCKHSSRASAVLGRSSATERSLASQPAPGCATPPVGRDCRPAWRAQPSSVEAAHRIVTLLGLAPQSGFYHWHHREDRLSQQSSPRCGKVYRAQIRRRLSSLLWFHSQASQPPLPPALRLRAGAPPASNLWSKEQL